MGKNGNLIEIVFNENSGILIQQYSLIKIIR